MKKRDIHAGEIYWIKCKYSDYDEPYNGLVKVISPPDDGEFVDCELMPLRVGLDDGEIELFDFSGYPSHFEAAEFVCPATEGMLLLNDVVEKMMLSKRIVEKECSKFIKREAKLGKKIYLLQVEERKNRKQENVE